MESHPRRRLRWSGRWKGKNLVRIQCIWRFRYGPPTHLKGLHRTVCIIFFISDLCFDLRHPCHPATPHPYAYTCTGSHSHPNARVNASFHLILTFFPILDPDYNSWFCPSWIFRWATYSKGGFKEGVSLSVDDELNRWQKYSYGCNEWVFDSSIRPFHPFPFQPLLSMITFFDNPFFVNFAQIALQPYRTMVAQRTYQSPNPQVLMVQSSTALQDLDVGVYVYFVLFVRTPG